MPPEPTTSLPALILDELRAMRKEQREAHKELLIAVQRVGSQTVRGLDRLDRHNPERPYVA